MVDSDPQPVWSKRLGYFIQESFDFIGEAAKHHRENVVVRAVPLRDSDHRVVYRFGVRGELVPDDMTEKLRDILGRARSLLDIAMFTTATAAAAPPLTEKQERNIYFPICSTADAWSTAERSPHMSALTQTQRDAIRECQPFATGDPVVHWFQEVHNADKHRRPLELAVVPDPEFVMLFMNVDPPIHESREYWIDWVEPLPQVAQRVEFVEYRSADRIRDAGIEDVSIALAIWVDDGWRDIQHLLWDIMEFTTRVCQILDDGNTDLADSLKELFDHNRAVLAAFKKMMLTGDSEAEREWRTLAGDISDKTVTEKPPAGAIANSHLHRQSAPLTFDALGAQTFRKIPPPRA